MTSLFSLENVSVLHNNHTILHNLSLNIKKGENFSLLGASGAGKTTLLRLLLGLLAPSTGLIRIENQIVAQNNKIIVEPKQRDLAVVFQNLALWPHMNVSQNLEFGLISLKLTKTERKERIKLTLERVNLSHLIHRYPSELSGGEQQRVAIARALVMQPRAILLDEPLSHLDIVLRKELLAFFHELFQELNTTVIYVTHDPIEALQISQNCILLENGSLTYQGSLHELPKQHNSPFIRAIQDIIN